MDSSWPPEPLEPEFSFQDVFGVDLGITADADCSLLWNTSLDAAPSEAHFLPSGAAAFPLLVLLGDWGRLESH